ncbi:uncharacterized protein SAPINGB_P002824 [Magnusiomyces paraingens]|uniref:Chromatin modification-related protein EAF3 n=1 Tax=Magnusiomyces paraingens TaxID=2606893 RepID=A0A5E8BHW0_9ASCO|nr:uncharacterized protein SAPINGB_P002824 [Saprochaete ingens]VVT50619.1 unnamed protein product [Saprochaete ingens]
MAPPSFPHKCLAFHGPMLYEAKTIKIWDPEEQTVRTKSSETSGEPYFTKDEIPSDLPPELETKVAYYIHYKGWKSTWDEWVSDDRVLAWNEENLRTQKELKTIALAAANKRRQGTGSVAISVVSGSHNGPNGSSVPDNVINGDSAHDNSANGHHGDCDDDPDGITRGSPSVDHVAGTKRRESSHKDEVVHSGRTTKRGRNLDLDLEKEEDYIRKPEVSLTVPDPLKSVLVDDWEYITKEHQVVPLPREITVADMLDMYRKSVGKKKPGTAEYDIFEEVLAGVKLYFDRALGNILLYRFERQQYLSIKQKYPDKPASEIYGPEHLLRLFVSFPALIAQTNMDQQSIGVLREHLQDLLRYMADHKKKLFLKDYKNTSPQYEAISRSF